MKEAPTVCRCWGFYLSSALTKSLNRIRHSNEYRFFYRFYAVDERGGVMKFSEYLDLFVVLCRLVLYGVEIWKAHRDNGENSGS